jgi:hypothetical protein
VKKKNWNSKNRIKAYFSKREHNIWDSWTEFLREDPEEIQVLVGTIPKSGTRAIYLIILDSEDKVEDLADGGYGAWIPAYGQIGEEPKKKSKKRGKKRGKG